MAGNYPDVPSWRMAWDVDGTQLFTVLDGSPPVQRSGAEAVALNNEGVDFSLIFSTGDTGYIILIFPELRDLDGFWYSSDANETNTLMTLAEVSTNTTNGLDGTWTTYLSGSLTDYGFTAPKARNNIRAGTALGVKGIRFRRTQGNQIAGHTSSIHLYGEPAPGENLQRLEIWHPTLDQRIGPADLDWGDVPRNSSAIRSFRIKNMHPTLTANNVRAAMSILTDTSPSVVGQQSISKDGVTWAAQQTLTNPLGPGAISPILQIRRQTPSNASLSLWWYRLFSDASSWT